jgi:hypothetical protein
MSSGPSQCNIIIRQYWLWKGIKVYLQGLLVSYNGVSEQTDQNEEPVVALSKL